MKTITTNENKTSTLEELKVNMLIIKLELCLEWYESGLCNTLKHVEKSHKQFSNRVLENIILFPFYSY
jgi:hypothetical protein